QGQKDKAETLLQEIIKEHPARHEPWIALVALVAKKGDPALPRQLMQTAEKRFKDKVDFRLAQLRFWAQSNDDEAQPALKRLDDDLAMFEAGEQSVLLQAIAEVHYDAGRYRDSARALGRLM